MQKVLKQFISRSDILKIIAIFLVSYAISLLLWIQVRDAYCHTMALVTSRIVGGLKGARLVDIANEGDTVGARFRPIGKGGDTIAHVSVPTNYTFNAPLTVAIMACMYLFITRRSRAYTEVVCPTV